MKIRNLDLLLILVTIGLTTVLMSACSKGTTEQTVTTDTSHTFSQNSGLPVTNVQVDPSTVDTSVSSGQSTQNDVHVSAPFVHVDVDKGGGGVHVNTPWVHVNKPGRGSSTDVNVPNPDVSY